jgi:hypothetical protein
MAAPVARLEPYGIAILLGILIVLPLLGAQLGVDLNIVSRVIRVFTGAILGACPSNRKSPSSAKQNSHWGKLR